MKRRASPSAGPAARGLFVLLCGLAVLPLWLVHYPPIVDLPQHGAQVEMLRNWQSPACDYPSTLRIDPLTPYLLASGLTLALAQWVSVLTALKLVLSLSIVATAVAFAGFVRAVGAPPRWSCLGLLLAWGPSMHWGLLSYVVAVPLALLVLTLSVRWHGQHRRSVGVLLGVVLLALFVAHALAFAFAWLAGLLLAPRARGPQGRSSPGRSRFPAPALPFLAPLPLVVAWAAAIGAERPETGVVTWGGEVRLLDLFADLLGAPATLPFVVAGVVLCLSLWHGRPLSRRPWDWAPALVFLALYLLLPAQFSGTGLLAERALVLLVPLAVLALRPVDDGAAAGRRAAPALLLPVLVGAWLVALGVSFAVFERESADFRAVLADLEPGHRGLNAVASTSSAVALAPMTYLHFPLWYQVEGGGCLVELSFAVYLAPVVQFRDPSLAVVGPGTEVYPNSFRWDDPAIDDIRYFFTRSTDGSLPERLLQRDDLVPAARSGSWSVWERGTGPRQEQESSRPRTASR